MFDEPRSGKQRKGKGGLWPWLIGAGVAFAGWYFYDKKKRAQALERQRQQELLREQREQEQHSPGEGVTLPKETGFSAAEKLRSMVDPTPPGHRERGDPFRG